MQSNTYANPLQPSRHVLNLSSVVCSQQLQVGEGKILYGMQKRRQTWYLHTALVANQPGRFTVVDFLPWWG